MSQYKSICLFLVIFLVCNSTTYPVTASDVQIIEIYNNGPIIELELEPYELTSSKDLNQTLVIFLAFGINSTESIDIESAILFFHTSTDTYLLMWMIGNPYLEQTWIVDTETEHFDMYDYQLEIIFSEYLNIFNPEVRIYAFAKILENIVVNENKHDMSDILDEFRDSFPFPVNLTYSLPYTTSTHSTSTTTTTTFGGNSSTIPTTTTTPLQLSTPLEFSLISFIQLSLIVFYHRKHKKT
ncbi:MAG: hypothetical protein ACTSW1_11495 [Candidatus Hodarchaeales archaeon]